jgi:hypothetical protein
MPGSITAWYVISLLMNKGYSKGITEEIPAISPESCPDIHRGKAIAATGAGILSFTGLSFLGITAAALIVAFFGCVVYGIGVALLAL